MSIEPDTKDWTWVIEQPCPECGYDPATVRREEIASQVRENARGWPAALSVPGAYVRREPGVWSRLEYACHVRDVHALFALRVRLMLELDDPEFDNWDQDATAVEQEYHRQDPAVVGRELDLRTDAVAVVYESVPPDGWHRTGRRSNGSLFTVETIGRYHLHDVVHHLWDVRPSPGPKGDRRVTGEP